MSPSIIWTRRVLLAAMDMKNTPRDLHSSSDQTNAKYKIVSLFTLNNTYFKIMLALLNTLVQIFNCRRAALLQLFFSASRSHWLQYCTATALLIFHGSYSVFQRQLQMCKEAPQSHNLDSKFCALPQSRWLFLASHLPHVLSIPNLAPILLKSLILSFKWGNPISQKNHWGQASI